MIFGNYEIPIDDKLCGNLVYFSRSKISDKLYIKVSLLLLQVQLQSIFQSKHVEHFLFQVLELQKQLTVADSVLIVWMEVQRTWVYLESIFKGCDDICQQLPADAHRFLAIDADFQVDLITQDRCLKSHPVDIPILSIVSILNVDILVMTGINVGQC